MSFTPVVIPKDVDTAARAEVSSAEAVDFLDDGTILTGYAPETDVEDGADLIRRYKVKSGDTLVTIARKFDVSMMTLWWANKLKSKDDLHIGQVLRIPPVSGLVVTVKDTDTLESLATKHGVKAAKILELNGLDDPTLVVGQVLVLPGAKGAPIPTPKPTPKPAAKAGPPAVAVASGPSQQQAPKRRRELQRRPVPLAGRRRRQLRQPVLPRRPRRHRHRRRLRVARRRRGRWPGGVRRLEVQRRRLAGLDLARRRDCTPRTTTCRASSVGSGQSVGRGQRVGRLGASGWATGPHLHFEVWRGGMPWSGGSQVNPMRYF